jgi:signal transduction histidine kinase
MRLALSQRLSLVFALLLLACCGASVGLQMQANTRHEEETVQRLSLGLAAHIAENTALMTPAGLNPNAVRELFGKLMDVNPSVELYLLNQEGRVIGNAAPEGHLKREQVDLTPVKELMAGATLPVFGDDPRALDARKVFSAAPLHVDGREAGYVYVVLQGETHDQLSAHILADSALRTLLWSTALVAILGLLAGLVAFRLITRPLRSLTETVRQFESNTSDVIQNPPADEPMRPGERDEIVVLRHAYGQMAQRLSAQWRALTLQDRERRELVANISHDLRTPLTSLHGYLETLQLKADTLAPEERRRYLNIALAQSRKVGRLAQELFELARLESGLVQPEKETFSVAELVQDVLQKFELAAEARHIDLRADIGYPLPPASADLGMIERVLTNLLDNAIRHTPVNGNVDVSLRNSHGGITVVVADSGPGISAEQRVSLFKRPSSLGPDRSDRGGLGLLIVQRLLQLHASEIRLLEQADKGAVFEFELPLAQARA